MIVSKNSLLSPAKRADLFELMQCQIGYEPNQLQLFEWRVQKLSKHSSLEFIISKLVCHIETIEYFFEFDNVLHQPRWKLRHTTDIPNHIKSHIVSNWEQVISCFQQWAQDMFVEVKGMERWKTFSPIPLQVPIVPEPTSLITVSEQRGIKAEVDRLFLKLQNHLQQIPTELKDHFQSMFGLLKRWLSQLDRATWLRVFVGLAITIAQQLTVSFFNDEPLWYLFRDTLNRIVSLFIK